MKRIVMATILVTITLVGCGTVKENTISEENEKQFNDNSEKTTQEIVTAEEEKPYTVQNQEYLYFAENCGDIGQLGVDGLYFSDEYPNGEEVIISQFNADVTHDGMEDMVEVVGYTIEENPTIDMVVNQVSDGCYIKVYPGKEDNSFEKYPLFISRDFHTSHAGNGTICISDVDGKDYLLLANAYEMQGQADYSFAAFYIDLEKGIVINDKLEQIFAIWEEEHNDWNNQIHRADVIDEYKTALKPYLEDSFILLSFNIDEGDALYSTKESKVDSNMFFNEIWKRDY